LSLKNINITLLVGTRPNFVKASALLKAIGHYRTSIERKFNFEYRLIHTGQHYDPLLSEHIFKDLSLSEPHLNMGIGNTSPLNQLADIIMQMEKELTSFIPDMLFVFGDVTSTLAGAIAAQKLNIPLAHIESGLRCGDKKMPEEINRKLTDVLADIHYVSLPSGISHLNSEGIYGPNVVFVGNLMIDTLLQFMDKISQPGLWKDIGLEKNEYMLLTIHRAQNVSDKAKLDRIIHKVVCASNGTSIVFPIHPRTREMIDTKWYKISHLHIVPPLPYLEFIYILKYASLAITDSGGISEETTVLNIPCITLRASTERPETVTMGTNELCDIEADHSPLEALVEKALSKRWKQTQTIKGWDGQSAKRLLEHLEKYILSNQKRNGHHEA